jgi:glycosyltransferase involved in cell wall biosynthesis
MKLSVVIPTYKFNKYIRQCIESVLSQKTDFEFEVLIRDDFSNDGTNEIIENIILENKNDKAIIRNFYSTENWGGFNNIKFLLDNSIGEYIAYIDGDDYFTDDFKLQKHVDFLDKNLDYTLISTGSFLVNENSEDLIGDWRFLIPLKSEVILEDIFEKNIISFGRVFRNIGNILDDEFRDAPFVDWVINYKLLLKGKAKCENWCGGAYRNHGKGQITKLTPEQVENFGSLVRGKIKAHYFDFKKDIINKN